MTDIQSEAFDSLNLKQQRFVLSYIGCVNGTQAAKEAGYSAKTAHQQACALLKHPNVREAIQQQKREQFKRMHMEADELLALIAGQARGQLGTVLHVTPDGDPYIDLSKATPEFMANVVEATIEDFTDGREVDEKGETIKRDVRRVKVKMTSPDSARVTLAKHLGLLIDRTEVGVSENFAEVFGAAMARAAAAKPEA